MQHDPTHLAEDIDVQSRAIPVSVIIILPAALGCAYPPTLVQTLLEVFGRV